MKMTVEDIKKQLQQYPPEMQIVGIEFGDCGRRFLTSEPIIVLNNRDAFDDIEFESYSQRDFDQSFLTIQ